MFTVRRVQNNYTKYALGISGLTAVFPMQERAGANLIQDLSANAIALTPTNSPTAAQVGPGTKRAWGFASASSNYATVADNATLSMGDIDAEIHVWTYLVTTPAAGNQMGILGKWTAGDLEYVILVDNTGGTIRFQFLVRDTANTVTTTATANTFGAPSTAVWYEIATTHDATSNTIGIAINNGVFDTTATTGGIRNGTAAFDIGRHTAGSYLNGRTGPIVIAKRILNSDIRTKLYQIGLI